MISLRQIAFLIAMAAVIPLARVAGEDSPLPLAANQFPNLKSMPDSSANLQKQIDEQGGTLHFDQPAVLRITQTLVFDLTKNQAAKVHGDAAVTLIMDGPRTRAAVHRKPQWNRRPE